MLFITVPFDPRPYSVYRAWSAVRADVKQLDPPPFPHPEKPTEECRSTRALPGAPMTSECNMSGGTGASIAVKCFLQLPLCFEKFFRDVFSGTLKNALCTFLGASHCTLAFLGFLCLFWWSAPSTVKTQKCFGRTCKGRTAKRKKLRVCV